MKRHEFEAIAAALLTTQPRPPADPRNEYARIVALAAHAQHIRDARAIADALARGTAPGGNRAFDRELFLRNAGVTET